MVKLCDDLGENARLSGLVSLDILIDFVDGFGDDEGAILGAVDSDKHAIVAIGGEDGLGFAAEFFEALVEVAFVAVIVVVVAVVGEAADFPAAAGFVFGDV